tara:strand:+ start:1918 stop:2721 length:804 start_codon:yes stop_codon:yes gene_type:complete
MGEKIINKLFNQINIDKTNQQHIHNIINNLDNGTIRVCEKKLGKWSTNEWIKKAILLYFKIQKTTTIEAGPFEFCDKIPLKKGFEKNHIRAVPHAIVRYGSFVNQNVILMPSYVNIGAYIDSGTMIDTWATIGSCAQIGKNVHISGGVGIGGVLEPLQAKPVIIEDNCFIGSRCVIVEGMEIKKEAVLGAGVVLTQSTKIIDVTRNKEKHYKGFIPERSVVIPGTYQKQFKAGEYGTPCALIIGKRKASTNKKTSLNQVLREFKIST